MASIRILTSALAAFALLGTPIAASAQDQPLAQKKLSCRAQRDQDAAQGIPRRSSCTPRGLIIAGAVAGGLAIAAVAASGSNGQPAASRP